MRSERIGRPPSKTAVARIRHFVFPLMAVALGVYVVVHSPLRDVIAAALGLRSRACYFLCAEALTLNGVVGSLSAWALIVVAALAAWIVSDWFEGPSYERPLVFGISALAFVAVPAAIIGVLASWSGTQMLRPPGGPLLAAILPSSAIAFCVLHGWRPKKWSCRAPKLTGLTLLLGCLASGLFLLSSIISLSHPPTSYDALSFHAPLAVFLFQDGNLHTFLDRAEGFSSLAHPGTAHIWFGLLLVAGGEYAANLGQLPFAILGGAAVGAFSRRSGLAPAPSLLAALAYLVAPIVVIQSGMQLNDVLGSGVLMATMALACAPVSKWGYKRLVLIGIGLGLVASIKLALVPCVAALGIFTIWSTIWRDNCDTRRLSSAIRVAIVGLVFLVVVGPWWGRNMVRYGNPVYPAALPFFGHGIRETDYPMKDREFVPSPVAWPLYPLIDPHSEYSGLGPLFAIGVAPGLILAFLKGRRGPFVLYSITAMAMLPAWWLLTRHEPRFLLPIFGLGFSFLPWSILALPRTQRRVGGVLLAIAAIYSGVVTIERSLVPRSREPNTRTEFFNEVWGVDPVVVSLPESEGLLHNRGHASRTYPGYYPLLGPSLARTVIPVDADASTNAIIAKMRKVGLRYAYVTASPEWRVIVEMRYDKAQFELVHTSLIQHGWMKGTRRYLYRLKDIVLPGVQSANP